MECESTCTFISESLKKQSSSHVLQRTEIAERLGLKSNQEILIEAVALKKLKENAGNDAEMDYLEQLITLLTRMHDDLLMLVQSKTGLPDYICPLSLEMMTDPVIVSSGVTYERVYIRHWLDLGLTVCPKTRQTLVHLNLIPNYTSKALIANWCEKNNVKLPDPMKSVNGQNMVNLRDIVKLDADSKVKRLVEDLKNKSSESLREATDQLLLFLMQNMDNRIIFANFGGIRLVVNLLYSNDVQTQENAVTALLYLAVNNGNKVAIADEDAIEPLIYILEVGTPKACENSAATLFCLSMIPVNKLRIGRLGAVVPLVELLRKGSPQGKNNAVIALFNLSISHENRVRIVQAGCVRFLVELLNIPSAGMVEILLFIIDILFQAYFLRKYI